ncbi:MAG: Bro-N domain-containing protein [Ktedonobacterales bacterium]|nr:Bro-N domain-containing protein [Ktedonobacterales bacterium]
MSKKQESNADEETRRWNKYAHAKPIGGILREHGGDRALFQNYAIRRIWHENEWWYSIIDCMEALSGSPNPRNYWSMMKRRILVEETLDVTAMGVLKIKLLNQRGSMRETDCANAEILLRLIQSVKSPNAEPIKIWLARVGAMVMDAGKEHPLRQLYRGQLDQSDRDLHELVEFHGVVTAAEHAQLTDAHRPPKSHSMGCADGGNRSEVNPYYRH